MDKCSGITHKITAAAKTCPVSGFGVASRGPACISKSVTQATAALSPPNLGRQSVGPHSGILHLCAPPQLWVSRMTPWGLRPRCLPDSPLLGFLLTQLSARRLPGFLHHSPCTDPSPISRTPLQGGSALSLLPLINHMQPLSPGLQSPPSPRPWECPVFSAFCLSSEGTGHLAGL